MDNFKPNTIIQNTETMAKYQANGTLFDAKSIDGSNFRKLMTALAQEFTRYQSKLYELDTEYNLHTVNELLPQWESALGIPDDCFSTNVSIEQRRLQCISKWALENIYSEKDWIRLAKIFGYDILIEYGSKYMTFPMIFPIIFGDKRASKFTVIITFLNIPKPSNVFPVIFPFTFGDSNNIFICLMAHLKPANVRIIYKYLEE